MTASDRAGERREAARERREAARERQALYDRHMEVLLMFDQAERDVKAKKLQAESCRCRCSCCRRAPHPLGKESRVRRSYAGLAQRHVPDFRQINMKPRVK